MVALNGLTALLICVITLFYASGGLSQTLDNLNIFPLPSPLKQSFISETRTDPAEIKSNSDNPHNTKALNNLAYQLTKDELLQLGQFDPSNSYYPITARYDLHKLQMGEAVLSIRLIECDRKETFGVVAEGKVIGEENSNKLVLELTQNYSMINVFNGSGSAWDYSISSKSINWETIWCEPVREFCLKPIAFEKYGLAGKADTEFIFPRKQVFSLSIGKPMAYQAIISQYCGMRPILLTICNGHKGIDRRCAVPIIR